MALRKWGEDGRTRWTEADLTNAGYRYQYTKRCFTCNEELAVYYKLGMELRLDEATLEVHVCDTEAANAKRR